MFYLRFLKNKNSKKLAKRLFSLIFSFFGSDVSESLIFLKSNERCKRIAHFAHQKWATMSDSLRLLRWNERDERIAHFAHQKWTNEWIAHFFERIAHSIIFWQKMSDSLGNQMSEFPALIQSFEWVKLLLLHLAKATCQAGDHFPSPAS